MSSLYYTFIYKVFNISLLHNLISVIYLLVISHFFFLTQIVIMSPQFCLCPHSAGDDGERDIAGHHQLWSHDRRCPAFPHAPKDMAVLRHHHCHLDRVGCTCRAFCNLQNLYGRFLFRYTCWTRDSLNGYCKTWDEGCCRYIHGRTLLKPHVGRMSKKFTCGGWLTWLAWRGCLSPSCSAATPPSSSTSGVPISEVGQAMVSRTSVLFKPQRTDRLNVCFTRTIHTNSLSPS